ncbi:alpha/beta hydrolase [Mucilaginibacter boryungensis]|uniref:Alpha/beta hydrolase n=1 Tax=Mucilaginibacter boryungensis TaxID=768480 RepID=A0ABR9XJN0_9SPHI|nr:alpha/beta hydrolase [Mucilaginibacter boryungensis]MBE9667589.1 alpha/beta hydrolase [Mucilaginibacter boryungensis]
MKRLLSMILPVLITIAATAQDTAKVPAKVILPAGYSAQIDVVYTRVNGWEGRADLYLPAKEKGPSPMVINIHGGGWNHGKKEEQTGFGSFFKKGYAVANMEYRLVQAAPAPAAIEDTRCMLIYIIEHANELNVDVNKIVIMGGSAGAHLALMAGLLENDHRFDTNCPTNKTIKVAAIIDQYGIADVWDWGYGTHITSKSAVNWLGAHAKDQAFAQSVSPISYVKKTSPPTLIVHGDADPVVPYQQSVDLYKKFQDMGVKSDFLTVPGGQHGKFDPDQKKVVSAKIMEFLKSAGIHQ